MLLRVILCKVLKCKHLQIMFKITHNGHIENMCKSLEDFLIEKKVSNLSFV